MDDLKLQILMFKLDLLIAKNLIWEITNGS